MILVTDLEKITCCPNCGNSDLGCWYNMNTQKLSKYCSKCEEEIFEKEPDLCVVGVDLENDSICPNDTDMSIVTTTYASAAEKLREIISETDREDIAQICGILVDIFERQHTEVMARIQRCE